MATVIQYIHWEKKPHIQLVDLPVVLLNLWTFTLFLGKSASSQITDKRHRAASMKSISSFGKFIHSFNSYLLSVSDNFLGTGAESAQVRWTELFSWRSCRWRGQETINSTVSKCYNKLARDHFNGEQNHPLTTYSAPSFVHTAPRRHYWCLFWKRKLRLRKIKKLA